MPGTLKVGGNIIATHTGVEGAGEVSLTNVSLGGGAFMFRNKIINGNFDIWQRGTSQTSSGYGSADRWENFNTGSTKTTSQQTFTVGQTEVPNNPKYYLRNVITTGGGVNDRVLSNQKIEDVTALAGKTLTFSFWAKADSAKNIATEVVQNFGTGGSPSATVTGIQVKTHNLTTSWQKFTDTISIPSISGKTIGSDENHYMSFAFWFDAGSSYNSRTNSLGNQSGTFDIAQFQLEEGTAATPFEHRPIGMELSLCQRYYQKSYDLSEKPGGATQYPTHGTHLGTYQGSEYVYSIFNSTYNQRLSTNIPIKTRMRSASGQTLKIYNPYYGDLNKVMQAGGGASYAVTIINYSEISPSFYATVTGNSAGNTVGDIYRYHWVVENEL
jgi:hypothetical protein